MTGRRTGQHVRRRVAALLLRRGHCIRTGQHASIVV
jgi:hypothetical protein